MRQNAQKRAPLPSRVLDYIRRNGLAAEGGRLLVAVSGGPDSVCLLHVLCQLQTELGLELHVAHLNHQLRGADSDDDARYVEGLARTMGVPATIGERDVRAYRDRRRISLEEAARDVRYTFLAEVARSVGCSRVAVGHTLDDNIETILMHLVRGTGTRGLRGLLPAAVWHPTGHSLTVIRPLLEVTREQTAAYCVAHNLNPRVDQSNRSLSFFRNRIRLELLPLLKSYNPRIDEALLRTAGTAADELAFLEAAAAQLRNAVVTRRGDTIILKKPEFLKLASALKRHVLRMAFEQLAGNLKDIETRHIEAILTSLDKPAGKTVHLPGGISFIIEYDRYLLTEDPQHLCPFPVLGREFTLKVPGETIASGWRVTATVSPRAPGVAPSTPDPDAVTTLAEDSPERPAEGADNGRLHACFDFDRVGAELMVRTLRPGDRFRPLGLGHVKKVAEFMIDAKIPRRWRKRVPIVSSPQQIIWVAGWRIDETARVTKGTSRVLRLDFDRLQQEHPGE